MKIWKQLAQPRPKGRGKMPLSPHQRAMRLPIKQCQVWEAYKHVRMNKGTHDVDEQCWADFDAKRYHNLYIIWNRLSSGAYFLSLCGG